MTRRKVRRGSQRGAARVVMISLMALTSACADDGEPSPRTGRTSHASSPTPPGPGPITYPDEGLKLSFLPAVAQMDPAAVQTFVQFERAVRRTLIDARLDPELPSLSADRVVEQFRSSVEFQQSNDVRYAGVIGITVDVEESADRRIELALCYDNSDAYLLVSEERRPLSGPAHPRGDAVLQRSESGWFVESYTSSGGTCQALGT